MNTKGVDPRWKHGKVVQKRHLIVQILHSLKLSQDDFLQTLLFNMCSYMHRVKILVNHPIDISRHVIGQKIHVKTWNFECEMDFQ
jgi:hypothetical protein